jgi:hypothetical protein
MNLRIYDVESHKLIESLPHNKNQRRRTFFLDNTIRMKQLTRVMSASSPSLSTLMTSPPWSSAAFAIPYIQASRGAMKLTVPLTLSSSGNTFQAMFPLSSLKNDESTPSLTSSSAGSDVDPDELFSMDYDFPIATEGKTSVELKSLRSKLVRPI